MALESPEIPTVLKLKQLSEPGLAAVVSVYPPQPPQVTSVIHATSGEPVGLTTGGYAVVIRGENLDQVRRVFFGHAKATRVDAARNVVRAIAPANGAGPVQVLLETDVAYRGGKLTNILDFEDPKRAVFTYKEPPKNESNGGGEPRVRRPEFPRPEGAESGCLYSQSPKQSSLYSIPCFSNKARNSASNDFSR